MSNLFGRPPTHAGAVHNEQRDSCRSLLFLSRGKIRGKPVIGDLIFYASSFVHPALQSTAWYLLVIVIAMMTMVKPAHASGSVHRTSALSWCSHEYNPATCTYSTKENACFALAAANPYYNNNPYVSWSGGWFVGHICYGHPASSPNDHYWAQRLGWLVQVGVCPSNSTSPNIHTSSCTCTDPYVPDLTATSCVSDQYTLTLTPTSATIEPGGKYTFTAKVTNQDGSPPAQPVPVTVEVEVDPTSGGHDHGGSDRPKGSVSPASGNTVLSIAFAATEVSGTHTITATCSLCSNSPQKAKVDVKVEGLTTIMGSPFYAFIGARGGHSDNHYLTPEAEAVLKRMAAAYQFEQRFKPNGVAPLPLHLNDASLVWGGQFDLNGNWGSPHAGHRRGVVIDVRANLTEGAIPLASFDSFIKMAATYDGAVAQVHCKVAPGREPPTCVSTIDGSQDNNRHFHILLLGVDQ